MEFTPEGAAVYVRKGVEARGFVTSAWTPLTPIPSMTMEESDETEIVTSEFLFHCPCGRTIREALFPPLWLNIESLDLLVAELVIELQKHIDDEGRQA